MAANSLSQYLHPQHEGLVRTKLGLTETVALFDKGFPRPKGVLQANWVSAWRISGPVGGDRFGVEAIYGRGRPPGFTTAEICETPPDVEIRCASALRWGSWIAPALLLAIATLLAGWRLIHGELKDWPVSVGIVVAAAMGALVWRGYAAFRVALDHDYVLQVLATALSGERVAREVA